MSAGKLLLLGVAIAIGYGIGFRDARHHSDHIVTRSVDAIRVFFGGAENRNDIDAVMTRVEGKD